MFSALIKAFTGRAGWLASLLALLIVVVIAYAVVTGAPRIQQKRLADAQNVSQPALAETEASNQMIEDQSSIAVAKQGTQVELSPDLRPSEATDSEQPTGINNEFTANESEQVEGSVSTPDTEAQNSTSLSEESTTVAEPDADSEQVLSTAPQSDDTDISEQSSLALRYDGLKLKLTGHLADDQLARLITEEVRNAIPRDFELTTDVDGNGGASPLNWMGQFLAAIVRLPDDAQGVISGSDFEGVRIIPDAEQTLVMAPLDEAGNIKSLNEEDEAMVESDTIDGEPLSSGADQGITEGTAASIASDEPADYILGLNQRMAARPMFATGDAQISAQLKEELDQLVAMLDQHPSLLLRIVGNIDFGVHPQDAEYVGEDRARVIRDYLRAQGIESSRVYAAPLPRDYAFDERVQVVFYISE